MPTWGLQKCCWWNKGPKLEINPDNAVSSFKLDCNNNHSYSQQLSE